MNCLLICALFFTLIAVAISGPSEDFQQLLNTCKGESKVSDAEMKKYTEGGQNAADATDAVKCFIKCLMEKQGDLKAGVFNTDNVLNNLKQNPALKTQLPELEKALNDCKNEKGANDCDTAFKITMCLKKYKLDQ